MTKEISQIKKDWDIVLLQADFDGTESDWMDTGGDHPVKVLKLTGLDTTPTLTFEVADDDQGTNAADVYGSDGSILSIAVSGTSFARFMTELSAARFIRITASAAQTDVLIQLLRSS